MDLSNFNINNFLDNAGKTLGLDKFEKLLSRVSKLPVNVFAEQCLRHRFQGDAPCARCSDICPTKAVKFEQGLEINWSECLECGICTTVCPVGALETTLTNDFLLAATKKVADVNQTVVFKCAKTSCEDDASNVVPVNLPCLGRLNEAVLLGAVLFGAREIHLDTSDCRECEVTTGINVINKVVQSAQELLAVFGKEIDILQGSWEVGQEEAESPLDETSKPGYYSRHDFLVSVKRHLMVGGVELINGRIEPYISREESFFSYHLPRHRELLLLVLRKLGEPSLEETSLLNIPFAQLEIDENCNFCGDCVMFCPTSALKKTERDGTGSLDFSLSSCTDCGLCQSSCAVTAIKIVDKFETNLLLETKTRPLAGYKVLKCDTCGQEFGSRSPADTCHFCRQRERKLSGASILTNDG